MSEHTDKLEESLSKLGLDDTKNKFKKLPPDMIMFLIATLLEIRLDSKETHEIFDSHLGNILTALSIARPDNAASESIFPMLHSFTTQTAFIALATIHGEDKALEFMKVFNDFALKMAVDNWKHTKSHYQEEYKKAKNK